MTSRNRRLIVFAVIIIAIVLVAGALESLNRSCYDIFPSFDSPRTLSLEASELLARARASGPSYPIKVSRIVGRTATLIVSQPIYEGDNEYAEDWQQIYARHHGGQIVCVHLDVHWKSGGVMQYFPVGPIF